MKAKISVYISGGGVLRVKSKDIIKQPEAKRQIESLKYIEVKK